MRKVKQAHPFEIVAWVVLPEHTHAVWSLPLGDSDYSMRWNQIKGGFSRRITKGERLSKSRSAKRERGIWQRRFWEHLIRDDHDLERHVNYVHYNPVKHGHAGRALDGPFSPFHRFVRCRWLPADWAHAADGDGDYGERR